MTSTGSRASTRPRQGFLPWFPGADSPAALPGTATPRSDRLLPGRAAVEVRLQDVLDGLGDAEVVRGSTGLSVQLDIDLGHGAGGANRNLSAPVAVALNWNPPASAIPTPSTIGTITAAPARQRFLRMIPFPPFGSPSVCSVCRRMHANLTRPRPVYAIR